MRVLPSTREEKLDFLLFPFKAYVIIFPIWVILITRAPDSLREASMSLNDLLSIGDALCVLVFIFAGFIQLLAKRRRQAAVSFLFAVATFVALCFLLPCIAIAKG